MRLRRRAGFIEGHLQLKYSKLYGLSLDWLIVGKGEVFNARTIAVLGEVIEPAPCSVKIDLNSLTTEEMVYTTRLLRIFRNTEKPLLDSMKYILNALSKSRAE